MKRAAFFAVATIVVAATTTSAAFADDASTPAAPETRLGDAGTTALSTSFYFFDQRSSDSTAQSNAQLRVNIEHFLFDHVSVGASLIYSRDRLASDVRTQTREGIGGGLRFGYLVPLADWASFWPTVHASYVHSDASQAGPGTLGLFGPDEVVGPNHIVSAGFDARVLLHVTKHLHLELVPFSLSQTWVSSAVSHSGSFTASTPAMGGSAGFGGWF